MKISDCVYILGDLLTVFGIHLFCTNMFPEEKKGYGRYIALVIYWILDCGFYIYIPHTYMMLVTSSILFFGITIAYNRKINRRNIVAAVVLMVYGVCGEMLAAYVVSLSVECFKVYSENNALVSALVTYKLMFFVMIVITIRFIKLPKETRIYEKSSVLLVIPIFSIVLVLYIFSLNSSEKNDIYGTGSVGAIISVALIVWINIVIFWLFERQQRMYEIKREAQCMKQVIHIQQEHYNNEIATRNEIRRIKHDQKNLLIALRADIEIGCLKNAVEMIDRQLGMEVYTKAVQSGFYPLDAIVGYKNAIAEKKGIAVKAKYKFTENPNIKSEDICVMVGNALDNAIEYIENNPCEKKIDIFVRYEKGVFTMKISNKVTHNIDIKNQREIQSTKKEDNHGYGLKSIEYIADKYGGKLSLRCRDNVFDCIVIIRC